MSRQSSPILRNGMPIKEPWDYGGLYFVGEFPNWDGWAEWNGMYRDDVRKFMKGMKGSFATRVAGSSDLYQVNQQNPPYHGVNFIIAHDGFTLRDHTILRGNWQMKNFHLALMISQVKPLPTYMNDISKFLAFTLHHCVSGQDVYAAFNAHDYFVTVRKTMADTNLESPDDFVKECVAETYNVAPFSSIPLKSM
ncbi:hypothetical protein YC2023_093928 [Brassica napus]